MSFFPKAFVSENPDGTFSLRITGNGIRESLTVTDSTGDNRKQGEG